MNSLQNIAETKNYYEAMLNEHGHSPKALGWNKNRQNLRFAALLSEFRSIKNPRILDVGCGFGDLNDYLSSLFGEYKYTGIDITDRFIHQAEILHAGKSHIQFINDDFLSHDFTNNFDVVVASGTFNTCFSDRQSAFIAACIEKAFELSTVGIAFDFLSDKVEYEHDHTHHSSPEEILAIGYKHTRNLILLNNYIPFEFSLFLFKDDHFTKEKTVFTKTPGFLVGG